MGKWLTPDKDILKTYARESGKLMDFERHSCRSLDRMRVKNGKQVMVVGKRRAEAVEVGKAMSKAAVAFSS